VVASNDAMQVAPKRTVPPDWLGTIPTVQEYIKRTRNGYERAALKVVASRDEELARIARKSKVLPHSATTATDKCILD
jgi:hypothetical protein